MQGSKRSERDPDGQQPVAVPTSGNDSTELHGVELKLRTSRPDRPPATAGPLSCRR